MKILFKLLMIVAIFAGALFIFDREKAVETVDSVRSLEIPNPFKSANPLEALKPRIEKLRREEPRVQKASVAPAPSKEIDAATRLYKWRNDQGNWVISDKPPEKNIEYVSRDYRHNQNVIPAHNLPSGTEIVDAPALAGATGSNSESPTQKTGVIAGTNIPETETVTGEAQPGAAPAAESTAQ